MTDVVPVQPQAVHPYEDEAYRRQVRRLEIEAAIIAKMPGLKKSLQGDNPEETKANVMAVGLSLMSYGIVPNMMNINQFDVIQGTAQPSCQLQVGLASLISGHVVKLDPKSNDTWARATLRRADNGEEYEATYTIEQAARSGALDFWYERWESPQGGGRRYLAEKIVVGRSFEEAAAAQKPRWAQGEPKHNPAWHLYREDMLGKRALKRVMRMGAPEVVSGVLATYERPAPQVPAGATIEVDMGLDDEVADAELVEGDARRSEIASDPAPIGVHPCHFCGTATANIHKGRLPVCATCMDELADAGLVAREHQADEVSMPAEGDGNGGGGGATEAGHPVDRDPAPASTDRPRPLAQQIAIQAQQAGVDHHHVIEAVCGQRSAKDVTPPEGRTVLEAISAIRSGHVVLTNDDGRWVLADPPEPEEPWYEPGEEPFT